MSFEISKIRAQFPILNEMIHGKKLVYLDSGATSLKPKVVIDAISDYYLHYSANVHRAVHHLSERATVAFENTRARCAKFIGVKDDSQIVMTSGTTAAINLVARSFGDLVVQSGDNVLITEMEHHANIVPWQMLCERKGAKLRVVPVLDSGELDLSKISGLMDVRTKIFAVSHISNTLGTINPVADLVKIAKSKNVPILIDGAQAACHEEINLSNLEPDFYVFSAHKMCGPTGVGFLYGKSEHLNRMPPLFGGGDMIKTVTFEKTDYADAPAKFEAGTPNIADVIATGVAFDFIDGIGKQNIKQYEQTLSEYGLQKISALPGLRLIGKVKHRIPTFSFVIEGAHAHDLGTLFDQEGVAVRTGHHCTQPLMQRFGVTASTRASLSFYNTTDEIDALCNAVAKARRILVES